VLPFAQARRNESSRSLDIIDTITEKMRELRQTERINLVLENDNWRIIKELDSKTSHNNRKSW
jgi:hypothetical protein